jgi:hypothetical protein
MPQPPALIKIIEVFDILKGGAVPVLSGHAVLKGVAVDEGEIADLGKNFGCVDLGMIRPFPSRRFLSALAKRHIQADVKRNFAIHS